MTARATPVLNRTESERPALHLGEAEARGLGRLSSRGGNRRVLFVQATNPGAYPPLIHASTLMAEAGWEVTFLSAPIAGNRLAMPSHPRVTVRAVRVRPSHVMQQAQLRALCDRGRTTCTSTAARRRLRLGSARCRSRTPGRASCRGNAGLS